MVPEVDQNIVTKTPQLEYQYKNDLDQARTVVQTGSTDIVQLQYQLPNTDN